MDDRTEYRERELREELQGAVEEETPALPADLMRVVEQVVARFVQRFAPPARYDRAAWQSECRGEAWRCVADALRTFDPARGGLAGYVARAVWRRLLDFRARECRWAHRACVSLDAPVADEEGGEGEREWADPASEGFGAGDCGAGCGGTGVVGVV